MSTQPLRDYQRRANIADSAANQSHARSGAPSSLLGTAALTVAGCYEMYEVLQVGGVTLLEWIVLVLFVLLFAWVAFSFMSALAGFAVLLFRTQDTLGIDPAAPLPAVEQPERHAAADLQRGSLIASWRGCAAIHESVEETGCAVTFRLVRAQRHAPTPRSGSPKRSASCGFAARSDAGRLFYRHRPENTARKSGNIEDWIKRFGAGYDHMIILDADSLMTGDTIVRLAAAMEAASRRRR